ncbi:MAG: hypothetical protein AB7G28_03375 [Pirellulales bacterium]
MTEPSSHWDIVPQGAFSRHFDLRRGGETVASLKMQFWIEGCDFTIAGHPFAIRKTSLWKDGFQLLSGDASVCQVKRGFWSRRFELEAVLDEAKETWFLQPAGWFTRTYHLMSGDSVVGTIQHTGLFTRSRVGDFTETVPLPVQVLAIYLVLVISQREQRRAASAGG